MDNLGKNWPEADLYANLWLGRNWTTPKHLDVGYVGVR